MSVVVWAYRAGSGDDQSAHDECFMSGNNNGGNAEESNIDENRTENQKERSGGESD